MTEKKTILGLDLGSNSIGWAVINAETSNEGNTAPTGIAAAGSRIIPMEQLEDFEKGNSVSETKDRRQRRSMRRVLERRKLRRARLLKVLRIIGWLPEHMEQAIDEYGNIRPGNEPKIEWDGGTFLYPEAFGEMIKELGGRRASHDWTIYYLRKKALHEALTGRELAWVLMNFNQKRGFKATRGDTGEAEQEEGTVREVVNVSVTAATPKEGKKKTMTLTLSDGGSMDKDIKDGAPTDPAQWIGSQLELLRTTTLKSGKVTYADPKPEDWTLKKTKLEQDIKTSGLTVGEYIFQSLRDTPDDKIIGAKVTTVGRKLYHDELMRILLAQKQFLPELSDPDLLAKCAAALYPNNPSHRKEVMRGGLVGLLCDDVILYQRPLKSKKSAIADCPFESRTYTAADGSAKEKKIKCAPRSHPLAQEFRLWQTVINLRVTADDGKDILTPAMREDLFAALTRKAKVEAKDVLKIMKLDKKKGKKKTDEADVEWKVNIDDKKSLPCYDTRHDLVDCLKKAGMKEDDAFALLAEDSGKGGMTNEEMLWHMAYSITDVDELRTATGKWAEAHGLDAQKAADAFGKLKPMTDYAAYSLKAIKRLLPLMRMGSHWSWDAIDEQTRQKITHILTAEDDKDITPEARDAFSNDGFRAEGDFQGLMPWQAALLVYGKMTGAEKARWSSVDDVDRWVNGFRHGSLNNPIVEKVVLESMRVVADIWRKFGHIDEIHLEMARELKKTNAERKKISEENGKRATENENIRLILQNLMEEGNCEDVNPHSPIQQMKLKIYKEGAEAADPTNVPKISDKNPTRSEIERYRHWLEQKYQSPYTGEFIRLSRLFTSDYEIEHVIPRSRFYDDSFNNKVICEAAVNKKKDRMTAMQFIKQYGDQLVDVGRGKKVRVLNESGYKTLVESTYKHNPRKKANLLSDDIPDRFSNRQMNDTRYIAVLVKTLLSNIVREDEGDNGADSKNLIVCTGSVTDRLKHDWGVNDKWNEVIMPRFLALDQKEGGFVARSTNGHLIPTVPDDLLKDFNKKRIDHRHHAMDAIVIACATRAMVQYLSNEAAREKDAQKRQEVFETLKHALCHKTGQDGWVVNMPWPSFPADVLQTLQGITASIKHRERVVTRTTNRYTVTVGGKRETRRQTTYAIRKALHKDTVWGKVDIRSRSEAMVKLTEAVEQTRLLLTARTANPAAQPQMKIASAALRREVERLIIQGLDNKAIEKFFMKEADAWAEEIVDGKKVRVFTYGSETVYATRFISSLTDIFGKLTDEKKIKDKIAAISDTGIQKILLNHLATYPGGAAEAFTPTGIDWMNQHIQELNNGKPHKPIRKVRRTEASAVGKPAIGQEGNKATKFAEAEKGTNLFFAVFRGENGRTFDTITLKTAIERRLKGLPPVPDENAKGEKLMFYLSINDLVQVTRDDGTQTIYKLVSASADAPWWIPVNVAKVIMKKVEFGSQDKISTIDGIPVKEGGIKIQDVCLPLEIDRLGNVSLKKLEGDD